MQSCYGITPDRLTKYYGDLRDIGVSPVEGNPFTKSLLYLSGLHYAFSYYKAARSGSEFETHYAPAHRLDEGLESSARIVLKRLMRGAISRMTDDAVAFAKRQGLMNAEWFRLQIAWISSGDISEGIVQKWLTTTGLEEGWLRLCIATGIYSLWATKASDFVFSMMRHPFPQLIPDLDENKNMQVANRLKSFVRDHQIDMAEL